jgi:hypothetical protein
MKLRIFVGVLLTVAGFLSIYLAVVFSFVAFSKEYIFPLFLLGLGLIVLSVKLINPLGIWGD